MAATARVFLAKPALEAMAAAAAAAWPAEACGLLLGRRRRDEVAIGEFRPTGNHAADPGRGYLVPPLELLAADREARRTETEIVGIWHSHPDAPPTPSLQDTAEAWEGYSYGIHAATRAGAGELRFFELAGDVFTEMGWALLSDEAGESR